MSEVKNISSPSGQDQEPTKEELQLQMEDSRERLAKTVGEIKETVEEQYLAAKETITGVLDYREEFSKEPLVWSLGALSAGFALGYTMGYAHKRTKGSKRKQSEIAAFADSLVEELSTVGNNMVMPSINEKIKKLLGFDFSDLLDEIGSDSKPKTGRRTKSVAQKKRVTVKKVTVKKRKQV
ncbi:MAG: hypothetical protein AABN95_10825 [Acidobacteriota bacterium]